MHWPASEVGRKSLQISRSLSTPCFCGEIHNVTTLWRRVLQSGRRKASTYGSCVSNGIMTCHLNDADVHHALLTYL